MVRNPALVQDMQIFQNLKVVLAGKALMCGGVGQFEVVINQIENAKQPAKSCGRTKTGGVQGFVNTVQTQGTGFDKFGLTGRFAAGKGYAAAGKVEDVPEFAYAAGQFFDRVFLSDHTAGFSVVLRLRRNPFRVVTPGATQRAAFHEDGQPYARSVVDGKFLNVENEAGGHYASASSHSSIFLCERFHGLRFSLFTFRQ